MGRGGDLDTDRLSEVWFPLSILLGAVILLVLIFPPLTGIGQMRAPSDYTGQVVDVEHNKGIIWRTSQLKMKTHRRSSAVETFCLHPKNHEEQLSVVREALRQGYRVQVEYSRPLIVPIWECKTGTSIVRDVEIISNTTQSGGMTDA